MQPKISGGFCKSLAGTRTNVPVPSLRYKQSGAQAIANVHTPLGLDFERKQTSSASKHTHAR